MAHKYIGTREVLDSRPHPTDPKKVQVKFHCPPYRVNGERRTSVWEEMSASEYNAQLHFTVERLPE